MTDVPPKIIFPKIRFFYPDPNPHAVLMRKYKYGAVIFKTNKN